MNVKKIYWLLLLILPTSVVCGQSALEFEQDFRNLAEGNFIRAEVDSLGEKYRYLYPGERLQTREDSIQMADNPYPLKGFSTTNLYKLHIYNLLNDTALYKNHFACRLIVAAHDTTKIKYVLKIMQKLDYTDFSSALTYMSLRPKELGPLLKTIERFKGNFYVQPLLNIFLKLDAGVLEKFSLDSLRSKNTIVKYVALRAMAKGTLTVPKEKLLKQMVYDQDSLKGWVISVLAELKSPDMYEMVKPYLNDDDLSRVSYLALSNSPSLTDGKVIDSVMAENEISEHFYLGLATSSSLNSQKKWIKLLRERPFPEDYTPGYQNDLMLKQDELFDDICSMIKVKISESILLLFDYFHTRIDDKTNAFLIDCLLNPEIHELNRSKIISILWRRKSDLIKNALPALMKTSTTGGVGLVFLLKQYENYDFKAQVSSWMEKENLHEEERSIYQSYISH